jgi:hypothetical protein
LAAAYLCFGFFAASENDATVQNFIIVEAAGLGEPKTPIGPKSAGALSVSTFYSLVCCVSIG